MSETPARDRRAGWGHACGRRSHPAVPAVLVRPRSGLYRAGRRRRGPVHRADVAMYRVKSTGGDRVGVLDF
ncbi:hypothetical protein ACI8AG_15005 [Blastococcus sp. SYSU DS0552]